MQPLTPEPVMQAMMAVQVSAALKATMPQGDAYTAGQYREFAHKAGFSKVEHVQAPMAQTLLLASA